MGIIKTKSGTLPEHEKKRGRKPKAEGAPKKAAPKGGKSRGKRKLTNEQVLAIVARVAAGEKAAHLAKEYGVSHPSVSAILNGRTYVWLTGIGVSAPVSPPVPVTITEEIAELEVA
jgi:hypothetical protein